jgi:4-hydroxybenzoate polyprenyltransferase
MSSEPFQRPAEGIIKDTAASHWVYRAPTRLRPYLQLSRLDRPVGYWLLALPGWIGLAFASLSHGFAPSDLKWAALILIGAIAMRGAGCTYNDIVDQDLDAQVERTALRPLPACTVSTKQAWVWLFAQCAAGLIVLLCLPRLAQIIALCALPLVAAYPFMKRITWWPQVWLGMTFNWAVLVAYAAKTGALSPPLFVLYIGLIFWTVGYDTIYACQDIEDDALIGIKSTARRFGTHVKWGVGLSYALLTFFFTFAALQELIAPASAVLNANEKTVAYYGLMTDLLNKHFWPLHLIYAHAVALIFFFQIIIFQPDRPGNAIKVFKSNIGAAGWLIAILVMTSAPLHNILMGFTNT